MGLPDHLTCLLWNLYAGQEATVRTRLGTMDWFKIGKGVHHGCILSPCLFNLPAELMMWNAGLVEAQAGIKIARRNINNLTYADDTPLMAEIKEELRSLLMKVKEETDTAGLKLNIQKWRSWYPVSPLHVRQMGKQWQTIFSGSKTTADGDCSHEIKRCLFFGLTYMINLDSVWKSRDIV